MTSLLDDASRFIAALDTHTDYFDGAATIFVARAPGRLDLMGGIADYSGSLVLELPLAAATLVAAQRSADPLIIVRSLAPHDDDRTVTIPVAAIATDGLANTYTSAQLALSNNTGSRWAAYVVGALVALGRERGVRIDRGLRILVDSAVPAGKGVASSAALEVAAMHAICAAYDVEIDGHDLAILCQKVENLVVGAPCGVMDQMTSACGEENRLLALLCQPAEIVGQVSLPDGLEVWGIDSDVRHEVTGADYGAVRVGAFMGYRIVAELAGLDVFDRGDGHVAVDDPRWGGYLANISRDEWSRDFRERVPIELDGARFLERYRGITDDVTRVDPDRVYAVRQPAEHPIREHDRVRSFQRLLESGATSESECIALGGLMYESHASYGACGLGSSGTDRLVELVREAGSANGLFGAKITGGGSGGVVAVLARRGSRSIVDDIASRYARETGRTANVLGGSSAGASAFGVAAVIPRLERDSSSLRSSE